MAEPMDLTPFLAEAREQAAGKPAPIGTQGYQLGDAFDPANPLDRRDEVVTRSGYTAETYQDMLSKDPVAQGLLAWSGTASSPLDDIRALDAYWRSPEYAEKMRREAEDRVAAWSKWEVMARASAEERGITFEQVCQEVWDGLPEPVKIQMMGGYLW